MASEKPIDQLRNIDRPWIRVVTVDEKFSVYQSPKSPTKLQRFIFSDEKGAKVQGIMFNKACETMSHRIQVYNRYKISNANIKEIDPKYKKGDIGIQWIIDTSTVIEEIPDSTTLISIKHSYVAFERIPEHLNKPEDLIDVIGIVAQCLPIRTVNTPSGSKNVQKFVLIDEKLQPLTLSMWQEFILNEGKQLQDTVEELPVLICRRLKVDSFQGIEVSTHYRSSFVIDGADDHSMKLKKWAKEHHRDIMAVITSFSQSSPKIPTPTPLDVVYTSVGYILPTQKLVTSEVKISFKDLSQNYCYMACIKCFHSTTASLHYEFTCNLCQEKQLAQPRCRFEAYLIDDSGIITATFFGEPAEKLLGLTAMEAIDGITQEYIDDRHSVIENVEYIVQIKVSKPKDGQLSPRYTVFNFAEKSSLQDQASGLHLTKKIDDEPPLEIQTSRTTAEQLTIESTASGTSPQGQSKTKRNLLPQLQNENLQLSTSAGKKPKLD